MLDPDGRPAFHLRWIGDDGPSALRARRPEGAPCLAVEGLVLPAAGWLREARRWWVDFTRSGRLSTAPMDERALAIVSDPSGAVRLYDRRERLDRGVFVAPQPIPLSVEQELRRPSFAADDRDAGRRWRTPLQGLRELGFIEIGQAGAQRFNPFRSRSPEEISLDWLNACGSVETRLRDDRGAARRIGLAEWSLQDAEVLCRLRDGAFEIVSRRNSRAARITADGRVEPLQADRPAAFRHGEAFLIGCLHLRYLSANGVSVGAAR